MNIITLGTDEHMLDKGSRQYERVLSYAERVDGYTAIVFSKKTTEFKIDDSSKLRLIQIPHRQVVGGLYKAYKLLKKENRSDTLVSSQDPFEIGLMSYLLAKALNKSLHVQVHTSIESPYFKRESLRHSIQYDLGRFILKRAKSIRVVSNRIKKFITESLKVSEDRIFVAPIYAGDLEIKDVGNVQKENVILMLSRIEKVKNIGLGIEAFLELVKQSEYKDFRLEIVGEGSLKKSLQEKYKNYSNIIWKPWTTEPEKEYAKAKVFLVTSVYEGWGMAPIEAISLGTPVVMTDVGCANECVFDNVNGQVIKSFEIHEVKEKLEKVLSDLPMYTKDNLKKSLSNLQSKDQYVDVLLESFKKTLL